MRFILNDDFLTWRKSSECDVCAFNDNIITVWWYNGSFVSTIIKFASIDTIIMLSLRIALPELESFVVNFIPLKLEFIIIMIWKWPHHFLTASKLHHTWILLITVYLDNRYLLSVRFFDIDNKIISLIIDLDIKYQEKFWIYQEKNFRKYSNFCEIKNINIFAYNKF